MGIFSNKKEEKVEKKDTAVKKEGADQAPSQKNESSSEKILWDKRKNAVNSETVLKKPRVTEKAAIQSSGSVYTFEVHPRSEKQEIARAFEKMYNKKPEKVNVVNMASKKRRTRFGIGTTKRRKKAIIFLKKGETIDFV